MSDETARLVQEASVAVTGGTAAVEELLTRFLPELRAFVRLGAGAKILRRSTSCLGRVGDWNSDPSVEIVLYGNSAELGSGHDRGTYGEAPISSITVETCPTSCAFSYYSPLSPTGPTVTRRRPSSTSSRKTASSRNSSERSDSD